MLLSKNLPEENQVAVDRGNLVKAGVIIFLAGGVVGVGVSQGFGNKSSRRDSNESKSKYQNSSWG